MLSIILGSVLPFLAKGIKIWSDSIQDKRDKSHELALSAQEWGFRKEIEAEKIQAISIQNMKDFSVNLNQFAIETSKLTGVIWVDIIISLVRPVITYTIFTVYVYVIIAVVVFLEATKTLTPDSIINLWQVMCAEIFTFIVSYWFGERGQDESSIKKSVKVTSVDQNGIDFITTWEGFVPFIYDDAFYPPKKLDSYCAAKGFPTIGIGNLIRSNEEFEYWNEKQPINKKQAQEILVNKLSLYCIMVATIPFNYNQNQFNSMVSFCYNIGTTRFKTSAVVQALKRGDVENAMRTLLQYRRSNGIIMKGLVKRRQAEKDLFLC